MTVPFDTTKPNIARIYDYWLGGKDYFEVDRQAGEALKALVPEVSELALENKKFLTRAVSYVAGQGVRQFLDIGSGLPTSPAAAQGQQASWLATHEAAQTSVADPFVAYVDFDPVAVQHSRTLLADCRWVIATVADMCDPEAILASDDILGAGFDLDSPACVILACVLHFVDAQKARGIVTAFAEALAPGSCLIISVGYASGQSGAEFAQTYNAQDSARIHAHSWEQITAMFDGLELLPPGIVDASVWQPESPEVPQTERSNVIAAGIGLWN